MVIYYRTAITVKSLIVATLLVAAPQLWGAVPIINFSKFPIDFCTYFLIEDVAINRDFTIFPIK